MSTFTRRKPTARPPVRARRRRPDPAIPSREHSVGRTNHVPLVRHGCPRPPVILETLWGYNPINFPRSLGFRQARPRHPQRTPATLGPTPNHPLGRLLEQRKPTRQTYPVTALGAWTAEGVEHPDVGLDVDRD